MALSAFIQALQTAKLEDVGDGMSLLSLGPGVSFPVDTSEDRSKLLVRDFYTKLLQRMKDRPAWLLTGMPGTGKSWWIWFAMFQLLQEAEPPSIVWQSVKNEGGRILFKNGAAYDGDGTAFKGELQLKSTWWARDWEASAS